MFVVFRFCSWSSVNSCFRFAHSISYKVRKEFFSTTRCGCYIYWREGQSESLVFGFDCLLIGKREKKKAKVQKKEEEKAAPKEKRENKEKKERKNFRSACILCVPVQCYIVACLN